MEKKRLTVAVKICSGCSGSIQISPKDYANRLETEFQTRPIQRGNSTPEKNCGALKGEKLIHPGSYHKLVLKAVNVALKNACCQKDQAFQMLARFCQVLSEIFSSILDQILVLPGFR
jgi:hypothetical protein